MMTLSQAERLVRKIDELLGQPGMEAQAAKLAQDYTDLGRAASRRLEQCAAMIESGDELQALQLAETPPALLNLITILSFRQAKEWRTYCQGHKLPWVEPFYDKHVRALNATYGKGIASDHPFYRDYRRAIMQGEDEHALSILRVIARLNPADKNTAHELQRLEDKTLQARLGELHEIMERGDTDAALAQLSQFEAAGLAIPPKHPVWLEAQVLRCRHLLEQAKAMRERDAWEEAEPVVDEIQTLANHNDVPLSPEDTETWNQLAAWTAERRSAVVEEQEFERADAALRYQVEANEIRKDTESLTLEQLRGELGQLIAKMQDAERFGRPIDDEVVTRYKRVRATLQGHVQQRLKQKRIKALAAGLLGILLLAAAGLVLWVRTQDKDIKTRLQRLEADRHVQETEQLLARVPKLIPPPMKPDAQLSDEITKAGQFVARETGLKQAFDQKMALLENFAAHGFAEPVDEITGIRAECAEMQDKLAPEFKAAGEGKLAAFDQRWQGRLAGMQPGHDADFSGRLAEAEGIAARQLSLTNGFAAIAAVIPQMQGRVAELTEMQSKPIPLEADLARRYRNLTNAVALMGVVAERLPRAQSVDDYLKGLDQISRSSLVTSDQGEMLRRVRALKARPAEVLGALLLPGQSQAWGSLENMASAQTTFMPDQPSSQEKEDFFKLRDDRNIQEVYAYSLEKRDRPDNNAQPHNIFTRGKLGQDRYGGPAGLVYDPIKFPDNLRFEQASVSTWDYTNITLMGLTKEARAFQDMGIGDLIDPNTGNYQKPILQLLDELNRDTETSAMFRAFVSLKLYAIAELHPSAWGVQWSPSAPVHIQALKDLGAANLRSGDWLVRNQYATFEQPLENYFEKARAISLEKQARFFQMLTRQACDAGFAFAGFVDAKGSPVTSRTSVAGTECWGWSTRSDSPVLLFRRTGGNDAWKQLDDPLPFSPLFVFNEDRRRLLDRAAAGTLYPVRSTTALLPPLFSGIYE